MKRKFLTLFLLLTMLFAIGCNKKNKSPDPTPTPTPTPVNLATENLSKLIEHYDTLSKQQENYQIDFNNGIGYDMTMDISLGKQIKELLGITDIDAISLSGTVDMKDTISADLGLYLNSSEVLHTLLFMDETNIMFNLPKYSSNFAAISMEELLADTNASGTQTLTGNLNPANSMLHSKELTNVLRTHLTSFVKCFKEADGITANSSIGTGDYHMTGDKYTAKANMQDVITMLKALKTDLEKYYGKLDFDLTALEESKATAIFFDYYAGENGTYAWAFYPDITPTDQIVFINTNLGFCLYNTKNGITTIGMTSEKFTENSGVIYLYSTDETLAKGELAEPMGTIDYEYEGTSLYAEIVLDTEEKIIEATVNYSIKNDVIAYNITLVADGMSFVISENVSKEQVDMTFTLASYGIEYATIDMDMTLRDYAIATAPTNTVDLETWAAEMNQQTMFTDLIHLIAEYPSLALLLELFP